MHFSFIPNIRKRKLNVYLIINNYNIDAMNRVTKPFQIAVVPTNLDNAKLSLMNKIETESFVKEVETNRYKSIAMTY